MKKVIFLVLICLMSGIYVKAQDKKVLEHVSIYTEFYKQKNYKEALPSWRYVFKNAPTFRQNTYTQGAVMMTYMLQKTKKQTYLDTLMMVYDQWIQNFPNDTKFGKGYILGKKGYDLYRFGAKTTAVAKEAYAYLDQAYASKGMNAHPLMVVRTIVMLTDDLYKKGLLTKEQYIDNYLKFSEYADYGFAHNQKSEDYEEVRKTLNALFFESGVADCKTLISILEPQFKKAPTNKENLTKIARLLRRTECSDQDFYIKVTEQRYKVEPSAEAAQDLATFFIKRKDYAKAEKYLTEAIAKGTDANEKAECYLRMAQFRLTSGSYVEAKTCVTKALNLNPNLGSAYIVLGLAYANYSKNYGEDEYEHTTVYWVAVDKFNKAKEVDPAVTSEANRHIATYSKHFPTKDEAFFHSVTEGKKVKIGDWINETTIARFRKE